MYTVCMTHLPPYAQYSAEALEIGPDDFLTRFMEARQSLDDISFAAANIGKVTVRPRVDATERFVAGYFRGGRKHASGTPLEQRVVTHDSPFEDSAIYVVRNTVPPLLSVTCIQTPDAAREYFWQLDLPSADWQLQQVEFLPVDAQ